MHAGPPCVERRALGSRLKACGKARAISPAHFALRAYGNNHVVLTLINRLGGNLISVLKVPRKAVLSYGVMVPDANDGDITQVTGLVVKPKVEDAPSNLIISGRYILQPAVMDTRENQEKGCRRRDPAHRCDGADDRRPAVPRGDLRGQALWLRIKGGPCPGEPGDRAGPRRHWRGNSGVCAQFAGRLSTRPMLACNSTPKSPTQAGACKRLEPDPEGSQRVHRAMPAHRR